MTEFVCEPLTKRHDRTSFRSGVDAKDDRAASFYQQFGFLPVANNSRQLFLPMSVIEKLFATS